MYDGVEYFITFNGQHGNCDDDLFRDDLKVRQKQDAEQQPDRGRNERTRDTVVAVMRAAGKGLTMRALMATTGLPMGTINANLYWLKQQGRLKSEDTKERTEWGRAQRAYTLLERA